MKVKCITGIFFLGLILFGCKSEPEPREPVELEWVREKNYQWAALPVDSVSEPGFEMLPSTMTGITFQNALPNDLMVSNRVLLNGSGVAAGDVDGDGLVDLYFTSLNGSNVLYRNKGGFSFEDITAQAGVSHEGYTSTGAVFADVNGNGNLDLLVSSLNKENVLYLNDGEGHFRRSENSGLGPSNGSTTLTLADIDSDGDLDLYIANYKKRTAKDEFDISELSRQNMVKGDSLIAPYSEYYTLLDREGMSQLREIGEKDELYINNGDGSFSIVSDLKNHFFDQNDTPNGLGRDFGLTAKFGDLNGDGSPDLYVCNDFWTPDRVWINRGDGTFRAADTLAIRSSSYSSMAVDFSDINHDSFVDMFVVEMLSPEHELRLQQKVQEEPLYLKIGEYRNRPRYSRNSLYINRGDNTFAETSYYSGLQASDWSWAVRFLDLDLDGYEDIVISTGFAFDLQDLDTQQEVSQAVSQGKLEFSEYILQFPSLQQKNKIFRNNGDLTFTEKSEEWGFTAEDISNGMAVADLDGDGDLEVIINRMNDEAAIYENKGAGDRIAVRLTGESPNTQAIGAKVELQGGPAGRQFRQITSGGDYVSGSDPMLSFAAESDSRNHSLTITWPNGTRSKIDSLHANRVYHIDESVVEKLPPADKQDRFPQTFFKDVSDLLDHSHHEELFNELSIQPLLPIQLSRLGPGIMWFDINSDGSDELLVGTGKGGNFSIFDRSETGEFRQMDLGALTGRSSGDLTGMVGWKQENKTHLLVGLSNYEIGTSQAPSALHVQLKNGDLIETTQLPGTLSTTGPLAAADYSGDGLIDLFIGGRFLPGQYPRDASSRLFLNKEGSLVLDRNNSEMLKNLGLVTGALFVDYNRNGNQDLVVTTEWGTVRLFENRDGKFVEKTSELGLASYHGWWQGIASGDFNNDGYPDLVAANWGENSQYQVNSSDYPLKMFYDDFSDNGNTGIIEAYYDQSVGDYVPRRHLREYKENREIFSDISSNRRFANATLAELLGQDPDRLPSKQINTLQHMVFLNDRSRGFKTKPLPAETQLSTAFDVSVADMDNDGHDDLFLSQNFFAVAKPQQTPRQDAGRGLWLRGNGKGNFEPVPGHLSGVEIYGEQRGAALNDFTGDGRIDLAVSQNGAQTRIFVNQAEKRGIRVKLVGPPENESGIGSDIRLIYVDGSKGPVRNIQAGSGYWSQNSTTQIMGNQSQVDAIEVQWYDGSEQIVKIVSGKLNYEIYHPRIK